MYLRPKHNIAVVIAIATIAAANVVSGCDPAPAAESSPAPTSTPAPTPTPTAAQIKAKQQAEAHAKAEQAARAKKQKAEQEHEERLAKKQHEAEQYVSEIKPPLEEIAQGCNDMTEVTGGVSDDPMSMFSDDFATRFRASLTKIKDGVQTLRSVDAPASVKPVHKVILNIANDYDEAADHAARGLASIRSHDLDNATPELQQSASCMTRASAKVEALTSVMTAASK